MIKVHLILGFLGAGKTTFLKEVLKNPALRKERLLLMVNDYGLENYDAQELRQEGVELLEITAGCLCCSYKNQFEALLSECAVRNDIDRILIEPSGLFIPDQVLKAFRREPISSSMRLEPIITIVDYQFWYGKKMWLPACERLVETAQIVVRNKLDKVSIRDRITIDERIKNLNDCKLLDFDNAVHSFLHLESEEMDFKVKLGEEIDHEVRFVQKTDGLEFANKDELFTYLTTQNAGLIRAKGNVILADKLTFISFVNDDLKVHPKVKEGNVGLSCYYL